MASRSLLTTASTLAPSTMKGGDQFSSPSMFTLPDPILHQQQHLVSSSLSPSSNSSPPSTGATASMILINASSMVGASSPMTDLANVGNSIATTNTNTAITTTATSATTTITPLMTQLGGGWRMFWYDHEREKLWKIGLPAFKQCKKKKIHYSSEFATLWYKSPYKYDMVLEAKNIDENTTAQIKLLFADNYEEVKSGSASQKQTITKNQNHFQSNASASAAAASSGSAPAATSGNSSSSAITVSSGTDSASSSKIANISTNGGIRGNGNGTGSTSRNGEFDRSVHVGPFQLQVCSFKLERPVCMGIYLSIPSTSPDPSSPSGTSSPHEHSVCCLVSPTFTIKSKKPPQGGKRKKGAAATGSPPQTQPLQTPMPANVPPLTGMSAISNASTPAPGYSIAGEATPKSTKRSRRSSRGLDNDESIESSSDEDTSDEEDDDEEDGGNDGHRKRRKGLSISTNGNAGFASSAGASSTSGMPTTPNSAIANFSKEQSFAPGFQGIGASSTNFQSLSPRTQQLLKTEQNQLLSMINSDTINLQSFEAKFDQMPQQQALDFLQFDYSLQQSNPVLFEDMMTQLTLQTASATDSLSANQIQSAILSAYGIPFVGPFDPSSTGGASGALSGTNFGAGVSSSSSNQNYGNEGGSGSMSLMNPQGIGALRSNEILNTFETMSGSDRQSLLVQLMDKLTIAEREVVRCKLDEYPRISSAPPM